MTTTPQYTMDEPYYSLKLASENFWASRGRDCAPAASYRTVNGKQVLGRYLDGFGCQACMVWAQKSYKSYLNHVLIILGICGLASLLDLVFLAVILPLGMFTLWYRRGTWAKHYNHYWEIQQEIERTGEPQWTPFDKIRLNFIKTNPNSIWP